MAQPTPFVKVKNKGSADYPLKAEDGEVFVVPASAVVNVPGKYTANFDPTIILILEGVPLGNGSGGSGGGGSQYPSNVPPFSVLVTQESANVFEVVTLEEGTVLARRTGGRVEAILISDLATALAGGRVMSPRTLLTPGNMTLINLDPAFVDVTKGIEVFLNGESLRSSDFLLSGNIILATPALNIRLGGTGSDGTGFDADDEVYVMYTPQET